MPSLPEQEKRMDDLRRTAAYRRTKSGGDEDVRLGSPLQKDHLVYSFHAGSHWGTQQRPLDEGIHQPMLPCFPCSTLTATREEGDPAREMQDA